jgi:metallo-beta-lactamase family protein
MERQPFVNIHGERIPVRAQLHTLGGFSAHAGQKDLLEWMSAIAPSKPQVVVTHGEDDSRNILAEQVRKRFGLKTFLPQMGDVVEL